MLKFVTSPVSAPNSVEKTSQQLFACRDQIIPKADVLWRIEHGIVRTLTWNEEGVLIILGYWGQGDIVGYSLSRLDPYRIECVTSVEMSILPKVQWYQALDAIILHIQQIQELQRIVHQNLVEQRLWQFLVWCGQKFGRDVDQGRLIDLKMTHEDIAAVINSTRVTVTRVLQQLEESGRLRRHERRLVLCRRW